MATALATQLKEAVSVVSQAGELLRGAWGKTGRLQVREKGRHDFVTELDLKLEARIMEELRQRFPHIGIMAEESGGAPDTQLVWILDPLDGTSNFIHRIPHVAISLALAERTANSWQVQAGIVENPILSERFTAVLHEGAFLNGVPIHCAEGAVSLADAFLATGVPIRYPEVLATYLPRFHQIVSRSAGIRRLGSAALDLCYTAAGRFHGFWEPHLRIWDIAAGSLIVREAGGTVCDFRGADLYLTSGDIVAGNQDVVQSVVAVLAEGPRNFLNKSGA